MRRVRWNELKRFSHPRKRLPRRRAKSKWEIRNSILFIKLKDAYLEKNGILVKVGKRRYRMNLTK